MRCLQLLMTGPALACVLAATDVQAAPTASASITVSAVVEPSCHVAAAPLAFSGARSEAAGVEAQTDITVACTPGTGFTVSLDSGRNASGQVRRMAAADGGYLAYEIYSDAGRSKPWRDGPSDSIASETGAGGEALSLTAYARILDQQAAPGIYSDLVTISITY